MENKRIIGYTYHRSMKPETNNEQTLSDKMAPAIGKSAGEQTAACHRRTAQMFQTMTDSSFTYRDVTE